MSPLLVASDLREYRAGEPPGDMTLRNGAGATIATLRRYHLDEGTQGRVALVGPSIAEFAALTWDAADGAPDRADQEWLVCLRVLTGLGSATRVLGLRIDATGADGYFLRLSTASMEIGRSSSGVWTTIASSAAPAKLGRWLRARFGVVGTTVRARVWTDGEAEPGTWISGTSSAHADGHLGLAVNLANQDVEYRFLSFATGGATAPGEETLPRRLASLLLDNSARIETTVELEHAPIAGGAAEVDWYTRRHLHRETGEGDYPANTTMAGIVLQAGKTIQRLEGDEQSRRALYGGRATGDPGRLMLDEARRLHRYLRRTFAGRRVTVRVGDAASLAHRGFEVVETFAVGSGEPVFNNAAGTLEAPLASNLAQALDRTLDVETYVGLPTWLLMTAASMSAPTHASYASTRFTVAGRFRIPPGSSGAAPNDLVRLQLSEADQQIKVSVFPGTAVPTEGQIRARFTSAGAEAFLVFSGSRFDDDLPHWWLVGVDDDRFAYLMVDGEVLASAVPTGPADLPAGPFVIQTVFPTYVGDTRFLARYLDPIQAQAEMASKTGDFGAWTALWQLQDGTGTSATDSAPAANHGALAGTYTWAASRLGDGARTGEPEPVIAGHVYNAEADRDDAARKSYRFHDGPLSAGRLVVRARGVAVASPADYADTGEGVADFVAVQAPPVTVDVAEPLSGADAPGEHFARAARDLVARRLSSVTVEADSFDAVRQLLPMRGGAWWKGSPALPAVLDELLGYQGGFYGGDASGRLCAGFLLPTVTPGPYGMHPVLEFLGAPGGRVNFGAADTADGATDLTIVCWFKSFRDFPDPASPASFSFVPDRSQTLAAKLDLNYTKGWYLGLDARQHGTLIWGHPGGVSTTTGLNYLHGPAGAIRAGSWYLVAARIKGESPFTRELLLARLGDTAVRVVAREFCTAAWTPATGDDLLAGGGPKGELVGSVCHLAAYSRLVSDVEMAGWLDAAAWSSASSPSGLGFYAPLTEGSGETAQDLDMGGYRGRILGARWAPRAVFDLGARHRPQLSSPRNLRPISRLNIGYRKNYRPLGPADVGAISAAEASKLAAPMLWVPWSAPEVADATPGARFGEIETRLARRSDAMILASILADRAAPGTMACELVNVGREGLALRLTDEVHLYHPGYYLDAGAAFRVVAREADLVGLTGSLGLWGGFGPGSAFIGAGPDLFLGAGPGARFRA